MKYKAVIFDLDGTLTDTLEDLYLSTNHALRICGFPERSLQEVRRFVGNGIRKLIERAVPDGTPRSQVDQCFDAFRSHYLLHCQDHTQLYPGIASMLMLLQTRGYRLGVVSNKLQAGVTELMRRFFHGMMDVAVGEQTGIPCKPAPDMVFSALRQLGVKPEEAVYVGDSEVDIETAHNAGLPCISVLWGFRTQSFLKAHGATIMVQRPQDIIDFLD